TDFRGGDVTRFFHAGPQIVHALLRRLEECWRHPPVAAQAVVDTGPAAPRREVVGPQALFDSLILVGEVAEEQVAQAREKGKANQRPQDQEFQDRTVEACDRRLDAGGDRSLLFAQKRLLEYLLLFRVGELPPGGAGGVDAGERVQQRRRNDLACR